MRRRYSSYENIEITGVAAEGKAIARHEGKVIFIPYVIPGDVVDVQITRSRSGFMEGIATKIISPSPDRIKPFCRHFGVCGGCKWQLLPYEKQLSYKQQQVEDQLSRIGKIVLPEMSPILGSEEDQRYRNKLEFTFSDKRWRTREELDHIDDTLQRSALGFHIPGMFDKVLDIDTCYLQPEPSNAIRKAVKKYALDNDLTFFNLREQTGLMRNLIIRNSVSSGEVMVIVVFAYNDPEAQNGLLQHIKDLFPEITSLLYSVNPKRNDTIYDLDVHLFSGREYMEETLENIVYKISPKSFFQTNSKQALRLYRIVRDFAQLTGNEIVYDLYTGTGTIALFLAHQAAKVIGIEYVEDAINDAKKNALHNKIENAVFYTGDMKNMLNGKLFETNGQPDVILLDPPRAGIHPDVAGNILHSGAKRIVYVSCNPSTQARDMAWLSTHYRITRIQPVDMFPHTHHVENVILAEKIQ